MLLSARLFETVGEVVDVLRQGPQFRVIDDRERGFVVAALNGLDRVADVADRLRQTARQSACDQKGIHPCWWQFWC